jgi:hypothetical protein
MKPKAIAVAPGIASANQDLSRQVADVSSTTANLPSVPYFYQLIVKGVVILAAICIDVQTKKRHAQFRIA